MSLETTAQHEPQEHEHELIRISKIAGRYLVFDIEDAMRLRRRHNVCGVFAGSIPQNPQQNVFMGLPMELLAEEAAVLASRGAARVVDDAALHSARLAPATSEMGGGAYLDGIKSERKRVEDEVVEQMRQMRLRQAQHIKKAKAGKKSRPAVSTSSPRGAQGAASTTAGGENSDVLFGASSSADAPTKPPAAAIVEPPPPRQTFGVTPTTSGALLLPPTPPSSSSSSPPSPTPPSSPPPPSTPNTAIPASDLLASAPASYPLYAHLHGRGYYMMPGLRFGCDYNVYPGDPLRFHSHFQATCFGWDEEIAMLDLVAGGRLGTGVKKGFLVGGAVVPAGGAEGVGGGGGGDDNEAGEKGRSSPEVRAFCIEWAGM